MKEQSYLLFDIGSGSVGGGVVVISGGKPKIVYTNREPFVFEKEINHKKLFANMLRALEKSVSDIQKNGLSHLTFTPLGSHHIQDIFCVMSAPWCLSRTKILKIKKDEPLMVTPNLLEEIAENEELALGKDASTIGDGLYEGNAKLCAVEKKLIKVLLNGYETRLPVYKKVTNLELSLFLSVTTEDIKKAVEETVAKVFGHHRRIEFNSFALTSYVVLRDSFPNKQDFIFIDISGEVTELTFVRHQVILEIASFPFGRNTLIRRLAQILKIEPALAESSLALPFNDSTKEATKIVGAEWLKFLDNAVSGFAKDDFVPTKVFLTVDHDVRKYFESLIGQQAISQFSLEGEKLSVTSLDEMVLKNYYHAGSHAEIDPFILIETIFLRRIAKPFQL
ncbi:MAG: hypothetical protein WC673_00990 [Candidatus Paceibacterota bacterium]|jgi:hypothetical protein